MEIGPGVDASFSRLRAVGDIEHGVVRPMRADDVPEVVRVIEAANGDLCRRQGLPVEPWAESRRARFARRSRYFVTNDPEGSFVFEDDEGSVVGVAQCHQRAHLWMLAYLFVAPHCQGRGVGHRLIDAALATGDPTGPGLIVSSPDPRAWRRYIRSGFRLDPAVIGTGRLRVEDLPAVPGVRSADAADLDGLTAIDLAVRRVARRRDLAEVLAGGGRILTVDGRGWAVVQQDRFCGLVARDEEAAVELLIAGLAAIASVTPPGEPVYTGWLRGTDQWALRTAVDLGLELVPRGAVMFRNWEPFAGPWLVDGTLG
jgi:predicted N-acetyltransferase YhbS